MKGFLKKKPWCTVEYDYIFKNDRQGRIFKFPESAIFDRGRSKIWQVVHVSLMIIVYFQNHMHLDTSI